MNRIKNILDKVDESLIEKRLEELGFVKSRVPALAQALDSMHNAISKLDGSQFALLKKIGINKLLSEFAKAEGWRELSL